MEKREKPDPISRSSIDTSTPRLQPDHRRPHSFSSPAVSPSYSDHSTVDGFYSPRGGEDEGEEDGHILGLEDSDDDEVELCEVDERGYLYRPRSPGVEMPVRSMVSRSVRVEPEAVTRVDEREYVERRVVEDGGVEFGGGGRRRKWEGRNTLVFDSGKTEDLLLKERRGGGEEGSMEFRGKKVFEFGRKEKEAVVAERRVIEEESVDLGGGRGKKSNAFVTDSSVKKPEEQPVTVRRLRAVEERSGELGDRRGRKPNAVGSDSDAKESHVAGRGLRAVAERSAELGDRRGQKPNAVGSDSRVKKAAMEEGNVDSGGRILNAHVSDFGVKEKKVVGGRRVERVVEEGSVEFKDGRGVRSEARNAIVVDSSPKLVYDSRCKEDVVGMETAVYETERNEDQEFGGARGVEEGGGDHVERAMPSLRRRQEGRKRESLIMRKAALCLRVLGLVMCVISFSIMVTNKNKGWALDSYDRYKEFRYCMAVSVLGFVYSAAQACILAYYLSTDKYSNQHSQVRYYLDFIMDQALSYLLISASSSAATRVEDWVSNWGRDKFPQMASASVIVSFLAFGAFAFSSLLSGHTLCSANIS